MNEEIKIGDEIRVGTEGRNAFNVVVLMAGNRLDGVTVYNCMSEGGNHFCYTSEDEIAKRYGGGKIIMGSIYYKQPNGRVCRYSTICDAVTDYNMSEYDIIKLFVENAIDDAKKFISDESNFHDFDELCEKFEDGNDWTGEMSVKEFEKLKEKMSRFDHHTIWERT